MMSSDVVGRGDLMRIDTNTPNVYFPLVPTSIGSSVQEMILLIVDHVPVPGAERILSLVIEVRYAILVFH